MPSIASLIINNVSTFPQLYFTKSILFSCKLKLKLPRYLSGIFNIKLKLSRNVPIIKLVAMLIFIAEYFGMILFLTMIGYIKYIKLTVYNLIPFTLILQGDFSKNYLSEVNSGSEHTFLESITF